MASWQGDFPLNANINIGWDSFNSLGAPVTISSLGTCWIVKNNSATSNLFGVTDSKDFNGTGHHLIRVSSASSAGFFTAAADYHVIRSGDTIDGQFFGATVASFSIQNRLASLQTYAELLTAPAVDGATLPQMIQWNYHLSRNTLTQSNSSAVLQTSAATSIATSATTDNGTIFTRGRWV